MPRIDFVGLDFFEDDFPKVDVIVMNLVLLWWSEDVKKMLIEKAYKALPPGGMLMCLDDVADDDRRHHAFSIIKSMVLMTMVGAKGGGRTFTGREFDQWCRAIGFSKTETKPIPNMPMSVSMAFK